MVVYDPRVSPKARGQVREESVLNLDLPSTFLKWADVKIPERYQGLSFDGLVSGKGAANGVNIPFTNTLQCPSVFPPSRVSAESGSSTLRYVYQGNYEFLHDLEKDPDELNNLAKEPEYRKTLLAMRQATDRRVKQLGGALAPQKVALGVSSPPYPSSAATVANRPGSDGFSNLISSGNRLRSWSGDPEIWSQKDGVLIARTDGTQTMNQFLTWKVATVRNFDLRVRIRVSDGANSGIQYRSVHRPDLGIDVVSLPMRAWWRTNPSTTVCFTRRKAAEFFARPGRKSGWTPRDNAGWWRNPSPRTSRPGSGMSTGYWWKATATVIGSMVIRPPI